MRKTWIKRLSAVLLAVLLIFPVKTTYSEQNPWAWTGDHIDADEQNVLSSWDSGQIIIEENNNKSGIITEENRIKSELNNYNETNNNEIKTEQNENTAESDIIVGEISDFGNDYVDFIKNSVGDESDEASDAMISSVDEMYEEAGGPEMESAGQETSPVVEGGYVFSGYLEDGTPAYRWQGEGYPSGLEKFSEQRDARYSDPDENGYISEDILDSGESTDRTADAEYDLLINGTAAEPDFETYDSISEEEDFHEAPDLCTSEDAGVTEPASEPVDFRQIEDSSETGAVREEGEEEGEQDPAAVSAGDGNYFLRTRKRGLYHGYTALSPDTDPSMQDGLHREENGRVRIYLNGSYIIDGGISLDGKRYYANEDGYLNTGWLMTLNSAMGLPEGTVRSDAYVLRYCDPESCEMAEGYRVIDGMGHYFTDNRTMLVNKQVMVDGRMYYCDSYGVCGPIRLRYGNPVTASPDPDNAAYLARNQVTAVDCAVFEGQDGAYSFRPKWVEGKTTMELFGGEFRETPDGYYLTLYDDSLKGKIGCIYRNAGSYLGRMIDLKMTIVDYTCFSFCGDREIGYFYVFKKDIALNTSNLKDITADLEFIDHETGKKVSLKGYATFSDIDIGQGIEILSDVDEVYVDQNCVLFKDPGALSFTSGYILPRAGNAVENTDKENWVQVNYSADHLTYRFWCAYADYVFEDSSLPVIGEANKIWAEDYTGNTADYAIAKPSGNLNQCVQGLYFMRLGRVSLPPVTKTVSDEDESEVTGNRLQKREEDFTYALYHSVPAESEEYYYDAYILSDRLNADLSPQLLSARVTAEDGSDVSDRFTFKAEDRTISWEADPDFVKSDAFYDRTYRFSIRVNLREDLPGSVFTGEEYTVKNTGNLTVSRLSGTEEQVSNEVITRIMLPLGEIRIDKIIREDEILRAHGNPAFFFRLEKIEGGNVSRSYEDYVCFSEGQYTTDPEGNAVMSCSFRNLSPGEYEIHEMPVLDYYLKSSSPVTDNVRVIHTGESSPDRTPDEISYGMCTLSPGSMEGEIVFVNTKTDYRFYHHNDVISNVLPVVNKDKA